MCAAQADLGIASGAGSEDQCRQHVPAQMWHAEAGGLLPALLQHLIKSKCGALQCSLCFAGRLAPQHNDKLDRDRCLQPGKKRSPCCVNRQRRDLCSAAHSASATGHAASARLNHQCSAEMPACTDGRQLGLPGSTSRRKFARVIT